MFAHVVQLLSLPAHSNVVVEARIHKTKLKYEKKVNEKRVGMRPSPTATHVRLYTINKNCIHYVLLRTL